MPSQQVPFRVLGARKGQVKPVGVHEPRGTHDFGPVGPQVAEPTAEGTDGGPRAGNAYAAFSWGLLRGRVRAILSLRCRSVQVDPETVGVIRSSQHLFRGDLRGGRVSGLQRFRRQ